jgi:hypothetical protein
MSIDISGGSGSRDCTDCIGQVLLYIVMIPIYLADLITVQISKRLHTANNGVPCTLADNQRALFATS